MINYFEFYEIPVSFSPAQDVIKQRFYALSKKYHPDFYINESQEKQEEVLALSTLNNKAFQVLKDDQKRVHYILELKGLLVEGENYSLPQSFLMEMMEVNEALMELEFDANPAKLAEVRTQIAEIESSLSGDLKALTSSFDEGEVAEQDASLKAIKDIYYRNKYLYRIKEGLSRF
jgi:molecular chaperone HscB